MDELLIGEVSHYFNRIGVAALALSDSVHVGDKVHFVGYTTDFDQEIGSLQIEYLAVDEAIPGQDVAMQVDHRVRKGDKVYKA